MATTLEDQLKALAEKHDLSALTVSIYRRSDGSFHLGANAHGDSLCASDDYDSDTLSGALRTAIENLNKKRAGIVEVAALVAA